MGMMTEFRTFALRGNVVDMAVGIVIGAAFGKIVSSLVADVIMPPLGLLVGRVSFAKLAVTLHGPGAVAVTLAYGRFLQAVLDFTIIALAIFLLVRGINALKRKEKDAAAAPPAPSQEALLLTEIRDLLRQR